VAAVPIRAGLIAGILLAAAGARAEEPPGAQAPPPAAGAPATGTPIVGEAPVVEDQAEARPRPVPELTGPQGAPVAPPPSQPTWTGDALRVPEPAPPAVKRRYLYQQWPFWAITGALLVGMVGLTYAVTRPAPQPYYGNTIPNFNAP
jgi:hypothetical protein